MKSRLHPHPTEPDTVVFLFRCFFLSGHIITLQSKHEDFKVELKLNIMEKEIRKLESPY